MDFKPFAGMSQEETQFSILMLLSAILDKLPRVDGNDRVIVNGSEITQTVSLATNQTLATLTTAADLTRLNSFGTSAATARPADAIPIHMSNMGAMHIYDNIKVS